LRTASATLDDLVARGALDEKRAALVRGIVAKRKAFVVVGGTGSGKTTQIPKMLLELGRGRRGLIGHTQPRRLAART
ncbi:ATPase, T2SS/T4P/T4SS family, partial [Klebsiella pneumoniae]|uniref:ATPase, T2SS/T4P/T4SS family n=1 Tax=Klebsiella pneumoniae TaxID=573 RepID=UPI003968EB97